MALPRFSDMLLARRRELGLSIAQASKVLKLKEQVLMAFEEGDFANIPKSGYAQGMLSSYARYLGLNPREIVDQFQEDLYQHEYGTSSHELRRRTRASRTGEVGTSTARRDNVRSGQTGRISLTEGPTGRLSTYPDFEHETSPYFDTTSPVHSRQNSRMRNLPLVNQRESIAEPDYIPGGRRYTSRVPQTGTTANNRARRRETVHTPDDTAALAFRESEFRSDGYRAGDVHTRSTDDYAYVDDLVYDDETMPYEAASTMRGRRSSRNIASTERPNVARSSLGSNRRQLAARRTQRNASTRGGIMGAIENFVSDPRRVMVVVFGLLAIILTLIIIGSVRSCASARLGTGRQIVAGETQSTASSPISSGAPVTQLEEGSAQTGDAQSSEQEGSVVGTSPTTPEPLPVTETNVVVSLADGQVSWIEIEHDGTSIVADTITGPWEQSFVVKQGINIQVGDTTVVTVTKNGEKVQFSTKASGVGTVYIEGTDPEAAALAAAEAAAQTEAAAEQSSEGEGGEG